MRVVVIADDITGAAEIAGIAYEQGFSVRLICPVAGHASKRDEASEPPATHGSVAYSEAEVLVIVTDTRSMTEEEAVEETRRIVQWLSSHLSVPPSYLFKKTDSALRGHVVAELRALMSACGHRRAVYMPANPSKGRLIKGGIYFIDGTPLAETAFSYDPEFPATTSVISERFPDAPENGIVMPDAETAADIRNIIARYRDGHTLFAGAADLFRELILTLEPKQTTLPPAPALGNNLLFLCGSTQSRPQAVGLTQSPMPKSVYDGGNDLQPWLADAVAKYQATGSLMLTIPYTHRTGRPAAIHLRQMMALMARQLLQALSAGGGHTPQDIIIEGGATAYATLRLLNVGSLTVTGQLAPGVVCLQADSGLRILLKPGSYPLKLLT